MTFVEKLDNLISQKGITRNQLLLELKLAKNSFVNWTNRGTLPNGETIVALANYFNISSDYLLGNDTQHSNADDINSEAEELYERYQKLSPEQRELIDNMFAQFEKKK